MFWKIICLNVFDTIPLLGGTKHVIYGPYIKGNWINYLLQKNNTNDLDGLAYVMASQYLFISVHVIKWYRTVHNKLMKNIRNLQNQLHNPQVTNNYSVDISSFLLFEKSGQVW